LLKHVIITIDGPSGTGKSTIAREVADRLGYFFLDTGAIYRSAAVAIDNAHIDIDDEQSCADLIKNTDFDITHNSIKIDGLDVTEKIRENHISGLSSVIAAFPAVRAALVDIQRSFKHKTSLVAEGRDTGSIIFPDADIKIYLDASPEIRAQRRHKELNSKGIDISYDRVFSDIQDRDRRDSTRSTAPLTIPEHAIVVNTTHLVKDAVSELVLRIIYKKLADK